MGATGTEGRHELGGQTGRDPVGALEGRNRSMVGAKADDAGIRGEKTFG